MIGKPTTRPTAVDHGSQTFSWLLVLILILSFLLYSAGLVFITVKVTTWYTTATRGTGVSRYVGTDLMHLPAYWDIDLVQLREEAGKRGFYPTNSVTNKFLVRWMIEKDYPWVRCR